MDFFERLFGNFFANGKYTPTRLVLFGKDAVNRFKINDTGNQFAEEIEKMEAATAVLGDELGDVDTGLATQKATTFTVDGVLQNFKDTMDKKALDIAYLLGGEDTAAFKEFYPHGRKEYNSATKTQMLVLTKRVKEMATKHATKLGAPLTNLLKGFEAQWDNARNAQQTQKGIVSEDRAARASARHELEMALITAVHAVGKTFPGDVAKSKAYFDFSILEAPKHPSLDRPEE